MKCKTRNKPGTANKAATAGKPRNQCPGPNTTGIPVVIDGINTPPRLPELPELANPEALVQRLRSTVTTCASEKSDADIFSELSSFCTPKQLDHLHTYYAAEFIYKRAQEEDCTM